MAIEFDFAGPSDKPALLALSSPAYLATVRPLVAGLGFKVHDAGNHEDCVSRFLQLAYQVLIIEECFACDRPEDNQALQTIQRLPMNQRRHCTIVLLNDSFETMDPLAALQQSVHAVVNRTEVDLIGHIVQQTMAETQMFLATYRETQQAIAQGKI